ncbi:MAG: NAD(P)H-hydrate dehydratase [Chloroflexi bacterium]|nr:NAD(P)H-hydrate dehydratase [Chloroflexota bacterium]MDA1239648.1 NAD(P)H-hydrate dehydratase [Chloroflexota bacterium]MQC25602.1 NAD(P)H-hydrate dehydratase [Chloroflexota bacterium]MQC47863.1 NAD(P)H-hydrate dehydratase [Chloroflexota bacterium]
MTKLVTSAGMRALEQAAVAAGVTERELMANAGLAGAQEAWILLGTEARPVLVLCGPGNNGGDGLVAALRLGEWGVPVHAYLLRPRADDDPEWLALADAGIEYTLAEGDAGLAALDSLLARAAIVIDALFGTGLRPAARPLEGVALAVLDRLATARASRMAPQLLALDLPSGVDADTGYADPATVAADTTVAFGAAKVGLVTMPGSAFAGRVETVEIGLPAELVASLPIEAITLRGIRELVPPRPADGNKGTFGTVVIAAGSRRYPGAARLAAEAAARSGCGLVTLAAPASIQPLLVGFADATHEPLPETDGTLDAASARALLRALAGSKARALLVGPGIGTSDATRAFLQHLLAGLDEVEGGLAAAVFDADALNLLAEEPEWWTRLGLPRVLTPHPGEMARLAGTTVAEVQSARLDTALGYAALTGSVVVLKGAGTVVAAPDGRARISDVANSGLAHAGTGDVLAGLIAGLIAQGLEPFDAASVAVYLHGETARQVTDVYGEAAALASDLLRALPEVRKTVERT